MKMDRHAIVKYNTDLTQQKSKRYFTFDLKYVCAQYRVLIIIVISVQIHYIEYSDKYRQEKSKEKTTTGNIEHNQYVYTKRYDDVTIPPGAFFLFLAGFNGSV